MRSRAVRLTLTLLALSGIAAAGYFLFINQRKTDLDSYAARDIDGQIAAASRHTLDLRAAQQAYVAAAQDPQFWFAKATATAGLVRESLTGLRSAATSTAARTTLDAGLLSLEQFERIDRRARDYATGGQALLASDVIFSDGLQTSSQILAALDEFRLAEWNARTAAHTVSRREQLKYAGAAVGSALLIILLLLPVPSAGDSEPTSLALSASASAPSPAGDLDLRTRVVDRSSGQLPTPNSQRPTGNAAKKLVPARPPALVTPPPSVPNLDHVAAVCSELARVTDTASLPAILERTAAALDASGIVLWVVDPDGKELAPIVSHGYPASLLSRMGPIARGADNVTAAAFRTGLLQVVGGNKTSSGAIAAPLVNPGGCIGVMSAELRHEGEQQPMRLAVATIVAAQLATLVAPPAAQDNRSAAV
ncbi:MAG: hypothetical protein ABIS06_16850 [Vicinamibacterales bacterium]